MRSILKESPCYLTSNLPGTGGRARSVPEDFCVEEIPLAGPEGEGEHLYLWIEKRGLATLDAVRRIAKELGVDERACGYAGLKDARAVTRQWISVHCPRLSGEKVLWEGESAQSGSLQVLHETWGRTRLRRGALRGNRFDVFVREAGAEAEAKARAIISVLEARGVPNAFGDQRFGVHGHSAEVGRALALGNREGALSSLLGEERFLHAEGRADERLREAARRFEAGDFPGALELVPKEWAAERRVLSRLGKGASFGQALKAIPSRERGLFGAALQAAVFNRCLAWRLGHACHDRLLDGDVVISEETGSARRIGAPEKSADALAAFEVSPAGPLPGARMLEARGEPGRIEKGVLEYSGLDNPEAIKALQASGLLGARRPYRAKIGDVHISCDGADLRLRFMLPPGAYATEVLREVMKTEPPVGVRNFLRAETTRTRNPRGGGGGS